MSFKITIEPDKKSFTAEKDETVLSAALREGIGLPYGCRNGACGTCKGKLLEGQIEYTDVPLTGITDEEKSSGYALFCQAIPCTDLRIECRQIEAVGDLVIRKLPCRVNKIEKLNHDVLRLYLKLPSSERLQFLAGQYIDILMKGNKRRSFSLANSPQDDNYLELHIRHYDGGVFSEYAFNKLREKSLLRFEGPLGSFFLREESSRPIIMIAGGTGFAPVKSIVENIQHKKLDREIHFYWGARSKADLYLHELAESWAMKMKTLRYIPVLSEPRQSDAWQGRTGLVHEAVLDDFSDLSPFEVYACGPPPMVHAVVDNFTERGLSEEFIYSDSFEFATQTSGGK